MNEEKTLTIKKSDLWKYSTFALLVVIVIGGFFVFTGNNFPATTGNTVTQQPDTQPSIVKASVDDDSVLGDANAEITIIEFSDFQCPFCRKFWTETLPSIKSEYIDTGKVKFVYRDFPLTSLHPEADRFAESAECVRDKYGEEAFWKAHDEIFAQQNILDSGSREGPVTSTARFTIDDVKTWLKNIGYNVDECIDNRKFKSEVQKDLNDATSSGGQGTPYFVIMKTGEKEGIPLSGAYPYSTFQQVIESI